MIIDFHALELLAEVASNFAMTLKDDEISNVGQDVKGLSTRLDF